MNFPIWTMRETMQKANKKLLQRHIFANGGNKDKDKFNFTSECGLFDTVQVQCKRIVAYHTSRHKSTKTFVKILDRFEVELINY